MLDDHQTPAPRFFLKFPPGYFEMTDEEKHEACGEMADEIHRQLGITPTEDDDHG